MPASGAAAFWRETRDGLSLLWHEPVLRALTCVECFGAGGSAMFGAVFLLFLTRDLGLAPGPLGLVFAVGGISSFVAAMLAERIARRWPAGPTMLCGLALAAFSMLLPALAVGAGAAAIALLVTQQVVGDAGATLYQINDRLLRQTRVRLDAQARVQAGIRFTGLVATLAGALLAGGVAEAAGARAALVGAAALSALGVAVAWASPLRRLVR